MAGPNDPLEIDSNDSQFAPTELADWIYDNVPQPGGPPGDEGSTGVWAHAAEWEQALHGMVLRNSWGDTTPGFGGTSEDLESYPGGLPDDHPFDHDEEEQP